MDLTPMSEKRKLELILAATEGAKFQTIMLAVEKARAKGWRVERGVFVNVGPRSWSGEAVDKRCCPLGALIVVGPAPESHVRFFDAIAAFTSEYFGWTVGETKAFAMGVDDQIWGRGVEGVAELAAFELGQKVWKAVESGGQ